MAHEIEAKLKKEMEKAVFPSLITFCLCFFFILCAIGVIFESVALLKIPPSDDSPLALNHVVLRTFVGSGSAVIFLALSFLVTQAKINSNLGRKSKKTKLLLNVMRKANQAEGGVLELAVEELNQEYLQKKKKLKKARKIVTSVTACFVLWIGIIATAVGVTECFFHPNGDDRYLFLNMLLGMASFFAFITGMFMIEL